MRSSMARMRLGMTPDQVIKTLGQPDGQKAEAGARLFTYSDRWMDKQYTSKADYYVLFKDEKVISYGTGDIRARPSTNTSFIIPVNPYPPQEPLPAPPPLMQRP